MVSLRLNVGMNSTTVESPETPLQQSRALYVNMGHLGIGQVNRFIVRINKSKLDQDLLESDDNGQFLWLRIRNREIHLFRPIYLGGPFSVYVDVTPYNYSLTKEFDEPIQYNPDIKPGQSFKAKLYLTSGSQVEGTDYHSWTVDLVSQLALTTRFTINYKFSIGYDYKLVKKAPGLDQIEETEDLIYVKKLDTDDIWNSPPIAEDKPVHLVIVTHGIFSNIGADMLYIRDQIEKAILDNEDANIIIRGYDGNVGKSEKGVKYLGKRLAHYILEFHDKSPYKIDRISFIGHSLGGVVQAYAVAHITNLKPDFFQIITPISFITLATPFIGVLNEFSKAVSLALDVGVLGSTGRDLTLSHKFLSLNVRLHHEDESTELYQKDHKYLTSKPILEQIIQSSTHHTFEVFMNRTLYANTINDGIVPLRTAALLYLDWKGLGDAQYIQKVSEENIPSPEPIIVDDTLSTTGNVTEIPESDIVYKSEDSNDNTLNKENENHHEEVPPLIVKKTGTFFSQMSPEKLSKRHKVKKFLRTQTVHTKTDSPASSESLEKSSTDSIPLDNESNTANTVITDESEYQNIHIPPGASTVLSAASVLLAPLPDDEYLVNPRIRPLSIFHDKLYTFSDLPPSHFSSDSNPFKDSAKLKHFLSGNKKAVQERIARQWHWNMTWRKVLVTLGPDAHNNIVVRRKYASAFGWGVIAHLVDNHFSVTAIAEQNKFMKNIKTQSINNPIILK